MIRLIFGAVLIYLVKGMSGFSDGFLQGLRANSGKQSACLVAIYGVESRYLVLNETIQKSYGFDVELHAFKAVVNQFTSTVGLCKAQALAYNMQLVVESIISYSKGINDGYSIYILSKLVTINGYISSYEASTDDYDKGFYAGKIFSVIFRYTI